MAQLIAVSPDDYEAVVDDIIQFNTGDKYQTHTIFINDDILCELGEIPEFFLSNIVLDSGVLPINVIEPQATISIDDLQEPECGNQCAHTF